MNGKAILTLLLVASLAGNAAFLLTAFLRRPSHPATAIDQLALTDDQKAKFDASQRAFQEERARNHKKLVDLRATLADEFLNEAPDRQRLVNTSMEMAGVQTKMRPKVIEHLLALHAVLTPIQRTSLANIMRAGEGSGVACPGAMLYSTPDQGR
jgi:Spy/CpxP family protein refolding chaperone